MTPNVISVIVPTIGRPGSLLALLDSLASQSRKPDEVIVSDGSSGEDVARVVAQPNWASRGLNVKRISVHPPNAVRQRVAAIAESRGEYLLMLDDDVVLEPDCVEQMVGALTADQGIVGAVADFNNQSWPKPTRTWRWYMRFGLGMPEGSWQGKVVGPLLRFGYNPLPGGVSPMAWLSTCNTLVRRSAYDQAGGFSDFFLRRSTINEDVDLGLKISRVGSIVFCPSARMAHFHAAGGRVSPRVAAEDDLYNRYRILQRTQGRPAAEAFGLVMLFFFLETASNFAGCLRRGRSDGFGARLIGRLSAMAKILKLVLSGDSGSVNAGTNRVLAVTLVALCSVYAVAAFNIYPSLYPDAVGGFLVRQSMQRGGDWNHMTEPSADDIATDRSYFFAVWSPGQYAVPDFLVDRGLTLGRALTVLCVFASVFGLLGWLLLFRVLGFDWTITLACGMLIAASRSFNLSFLIYVGSDLLAFSAFPFLAVAAYSLRRSWALVVVAPVLVLVGFFLKNSMSIYVGAWILCVAAIEAFRASSSMARAAGRLAITVGALAATALFVQWTYVSRGWTPVSYQPAWATAPAAYVLPWAMYMLAATSLDDVLSRIFTPPAQIRYDYRSSTLFLLPVAMATVAFAVHEVRRRSREVATLESVSFAGVVVASFAFLYATGSGASLNLSRHYLIPGYVLLPLLVRRIINLPRPGVRLMLAAVLAAPCLYGVLSFGSNWGRHYDRRMAHSPEVQVTYLMLTPRLVDFLKALDRTLPGENALVVTPGHEYALEFSRVRVLATSVTSDSVEKITDTKRFGTVDNLVVMAERQGMTDEEISAWLASFKSYELTQWEYLEADGFRFYVPVGQAVNQTWLAAAWDAIDDRARGR